MNRCKPDLNATVMPRVILVADDLTGAADSGVTFAKHGARVVVSWANDVRAQGVGNTGRETLSDGVQDADVVVISTESRHCTEAEAVQRVTEAIADMTLVEQDRDSVWIYKKVDSTLRGHPGAELAALMSALGADAPALINGGRSGAGRAFPYALMAPALPAQGRVTREGIHYVHGVPLSETVFGAEVGTSDVVGLISPTFAAGAVRRLSLPILRQGVDTFTSSLTVPRLSSMRVVVADAETDADLSALVDLAIDSGIRLLCGSAGLAEALAERLTETRAWPPRTERQQSAERQGATALQLSAAQVRRSAAGVLVVAGSRNPQTVVQIEALAAAGVPVVRPTKGWFEDATISADAVAADVAAVLDSGSAVLTTAGLPPLAMPGSQLVARLAEVVKVLLATREIAGLIVTGGDTAIAVGRALGATALQLRGEVERGVPWGTLIGGRWEALPIVTKAGGFGDAETLVSAVRFLSRLVVD